jgi:peptidoglycan/xylan/chitin deacetylase (PgdA/CDA1 family)
VKARFLTHSAASHKKLKAETMRLGQWLGMCVGAVAMVLAGHAVAGEGSYKLAITIDDLPSHGALPAGMTRSGIAKMTLDAYAAHKVPRVYGYINAVHLKDDPDAAKVLQMWRAAGHPLGNHHVSHASVDAGLAEDFIAGIEANEPVLKDLMLGEDWRSFRYPFLNAGDATRGPVVAQWLKAHDYTIADVSMSFNDWAYTDTHARCAAKGDMAAIDAMKARYMDEVRVQIVRSKAVSQKVYGRMIPQVLLTHIGGFGAIMLPQVLDELEKSGAKFVTLEEAQSDAAYGEPGLKSGLVMERAAQAKGIDISAIANTAVAGLDQMCR